MYIAASLDGYVGRKDYGYSEFIKTIGIAITGARTYDQSVRHPERMLRDTKTYILSAKTMSVPSTAAVEFYNGNLKILIDRIKSEDNRDIFIVGGGQVVCSFLNERACRRVALFHRASTILKEGIPLYPALKKEINLRLVETIPYKTGIVKLHYAAYPSHKVNQ